MYICICSYISTYIFINICIYIYTEYRAFLAPERVDAGLARLLSFWPSVGGLGRGRCCDRAAVAVPVWPGWRKWKQAFPERIQKGRSSLGFYTLHLLGV